MASNLNFEAKDYLESATAPAVVVGGAVALPVIHRLQPIRLLSTYPEVKLSCLALGALAGACMDGVWRQTGVLQGRGTTALNGVVGAMLTGAVLLGPTLWLYILYVAKRDDLQIGRPR